jgi:hypothetical protein
VLHAQAADVREAGRRALIESGARKEIAMMVTIVSRYLSWTRPKVLIQKAANRTTKLGV